MRQLLPTPADPVDPMAVYGDLPTAAGRPAVRLNMIASIDGATTLAGVSGGLGGPADHAVRGAALAGRRRASGRRHGPGRTLRAIRHADRRGLPQPAARLGRPVLHGAARPILVTVAQAPPDQVARAAEVADVVIAGDRDVDLATALAALGDRGRRAVLAEGGPTLNGQLARAGLLDELCLTLSPWLASGDAKRILDGRPLPAAGGLRLCSVCEQDGFLFLRYRPPHAEPLG